MVGKRIALPRCQFEVPVPQGTSQVSDCGEPAVAQWFWENDPIRKPVYVCEAHDRIIEVNEKRKREDQPVEDVQDMMIIGWRPVPLIDPIPIHVRDLDPYWRRALEEGHKVLRGRIL